MPEEQKRSSIGTKTMQAFEAVKMRGTEAPPAEWKIVFLKRGGTVSMILVILQFIGMWVSSILERPSPTNELLIWGLLFIPVLLPLAVIAPEGFDRFTTFVTTLIPKLKFSKKNE